MDGTAVVDGTPISHSHREWVCVLLVETQKGVVFYVCRATKEFCVEQLKRSVLFYVSRATEPWQSPEEAFLPFTCVEQLKRRVCLNG